MLESDGGPGEHYELGLAGKGEASKNSPAAKLHVTEFFNTPDAHQLQMFSSFRC